MISGNGKKKETKPVKPKVIRENVDIEKIVDKFSSVIKSNNDAEIIKKALENNTEMNRKFLTKVTQYLDKKIESINNTMKNKPSSFTFDIQRDDDGYIDKVYVKPTK